MTRTSLLLALLALNAAPAAAAAKAGAVGAVGELRGSRASIRHQHEVAKENDLTFLRTPAQVREFVKQERLERVESNADLAVGRVSFPYTRPIVKLFIERLAAQFRAATGERLVVTSLTRPISRQPRNASPYSVHPAGIAVDFRVPASAADRSWLENTLLSLETSGVLDVTRERRPPHYHVAVFPDEYLKYVDGRMAVEAAQAATKAIETAVRSVASAPAPVVVNDFEQASKPPLALIYGFAGVALALGASGLLLRRVPARS